MARLLAPATWLTRPELPLWSLVDALRLLVQSLISWVGVRRWHQARAGEVCVGQEVGFLMQREWGLLVGLQTASRDTGRVRGSGTAPKSTARVSAPHAAARWLIHAESEMKAWSHSHRNPTTHTHTQCEAEVPQWGWRWHKSVWGNVHFSVCFYTHIVILQSQSWQIVPSLAERLSHCFRGPVCNNLRQSVRSSTIQQGCYCSISFSGFLSLPHSLALGKCCVWRSCVRAHTLTPSHSALRLTHCIHSQLHGPLSHFWGIPVKRSHLPFKCLGGKEWQVYGV